MTQNSNFSDFILDFDLELSNTSLRFSFGTNVYPIADICTQKYPRFRVCVGKSWLNQNPIEEIHKDPRIQPKPKPLGFFLGSNACPLDDLLVCVTNRAKHAPTWLYTDGPVCFVCLWRCVEWSLVSSLSADNFPLHRSS